MKQIINILESEKERIISMHNVAKKDPTTRLIKEYDEKVVDSKKNEIISTLQSLKSAQKGALAGVKKSEIDKQIIEVQSINTKNVCNGTVLNQEISSKLTKAENTLNQYDSQLDDCPEGCKSKLRSNIRFIKEFCSKEGTQPQKTQDNKSTTQDNKSTTQDNKSTTNQTTGQNSDLNMTTSSQQQNNNTNKSGGENNNCGNKTPYQAITDMGMKFRDVQIKWVNANCNGTTPCVKGNAKTNLNLKDAVCGGAWNPETGSNKVSGGGEEETQNKSKSGEDIMDDGTWSGDVY